MREEYKSVNVLHICDYSASYRGNFIDSLEAIERYHDNIKNFYLFPNRAKYLDAVNWIQELNRGNTVAYIQEENILKNILLFLKIVRIHRIDYIVRHFSDFRIDIIIKCLFDNRKVIRFFSLWI